MEKNSAQKTKLTTTKNSYFWIVNKTQIKIAKKPIEIKSLISCFSYSVFKLFNESSIVCGTFSRLSSGEGQILVVIQMSSRFKPCLGTNFYKYTVLQSLDWIFQNNLQRISEFRLVQIKFGCVKMTIADT